MLNLVSAKWDSVKKWALKSSGSVPFKPDLLRLNLAVTHTHAVQSHVLSNNGTAFPWL